MPPTFKEGTRIKGKNKRSNFGRTGTIIEKEKLNDIWWLEIRWDDNPNVLEKIKSTSVCLLEPLKADSNKNIEVSETNIIISSDLSDEKLEDAKISSCNTSLEVSESTTSNFVDNLLNNTNSASPISDCEL
jgi:hypothetical protein